MHIEDLKVLTHIGVYDWEQKIKQPLLIDLHLGIRCDQLEDNINNTLDYSKLSKSITEFVASKPFRLIETVAKEVKELIQREFSVTSICVKVSKPNAISNARLVQIISQSSSD